MVRWRHGALLLLTILSAGARGAGGEAGAGSATFTRHDSAGVAIVENTAPAWRPGGGWRIDPEPELVLGSSKHLEVAAKGAADTAPGWPRQTWNIFGPDGVWLGELILPDRFDLRAVARGRLYGVARDELDVETVQIFRILRPTATT